MNRRPRYTIAAIAAALLLGGFAVTFAPACATVKGADVATCAPSASLIDAAETALKTGDYVGELGKLVSQASTCLVNKAVTAVIDKYGSGTKTASFDPISNTIVERGHSWLDTHAEHGAALKREHDYRMTIHLRTCRAWCRPETRARLPHDDPPSHLAAAQRRALAIHPRPRELLTSGPRRQRNTEGPPGPSFRFVSIMDDDFDSNDLTIVDEGGALPERPIDGDVTREHETEPAVLAAASGVRELPVNSEWERGFRTALAAHRLDLRRAVIHELVARGASATAAEDFWAAVLARSVDDDGRTA